MYFENTSYYTARPLSSVADARWGWLQGRGGKPNADKSGQGGLRVGNSYAFSMSFIDNPLHDSVSSHKKKKYSPLKLAIRQAWVQCVGDLIFSAYECRWPVLSLITPSSHWQCMVSVLIIADLARGAEQKSRTKFLLWPGFEPRTSSLLTTRPLLP